jgi:hypothetical protein
VIYKKLPKNKTPPAGVLRFSLIHFLDIKSFTSYPECQNMQKRSFSMWVYQGGIVQVKEELEKHKKRLEKIYQKILPRSVYMETQDKIGELLGPESFWDLKELSERTGVIPATVNNKFVLATRYTNEQITLHLDGTVQLLGGTQAIPTAPVFFFTETGYKRRQNYYGGARSIVVFRELSP